MDFPKEMDLYATHLAATVACAVKSGMLWPDSPILELGCGHYSTPILAAIARIQNRKFKIIASDSDWARSFSNLGTEIELIEFEKWPKIRFGSEEYGMVLVDNEESVSARYGQILKLKGLAKIVVLHDANRIEEQEVSWEMARIFYRYLHFFDKYLPSTAILSDEIDPAEWFKGL